MRSTKTGLLCGFSACLLCFVHAAAQAEGEPPPTPPPAVPGGQKTVAATAFHIDRSPMMTIVGETANAVNGFYDRGKLETNDISEFVSRVQALIDRIKSNENLAPVQQRFRAFLKKTPLEDILQIAIANLEIKRLPPDPVERQKLLKQEKDRLNVALNYFAAQFIDQEVLRKNEILSLELQTRVVGEQNYDSINLLYGNLRLRTDIAAQYLTGSQNGFGFTWHYDLIGYGLYTEASPEDIKVDVARYVLRPHLSLVTNYRHLHSEGDLYGTGLTVSCLRPCHGGRESAALFFGADLHYDWFEIDRDNRNQGEMTTKGFGGSLLFAWQDAVPFIHKENDHERAELRRWHSRYGVELAQRDAIVKGDYAAFFARWRDRHRVEYTLHLGSEVNGQGFVAFGLSTYFAR